MPAALFVPNIWASVELTLSCLGSRGWGGGGGGGGGGGDKAYSNQIETTRRAHLPAALFLPDFWALACLMLSCQVGCLRMENLKLSAACPLVPLSSAKGGAQPLGGTMHAMPHLSRKSHETGTLGLNGFTVGACDFDILFCINLHGKSRDVGKVGDWLRQFKKFQFSLSLPTEDFAKWCPTPPVPTNSPRFC